MTIARGTQGYTRRMLAAVGMVALAGCAAAPSPTEAQLYAASIPASAALPLNAVTLAPLATPVVAVTWNKLAYESWAVGKEGQASATPAGYDTWITVEPQAKALCAGTPADQAGQRMQQVLGLPPLAAADLAGKRLVRFRIDAPAAAAIFRPCGNPDTQATSCTAPSSAAAWPAGYAQWYANQTEGSYQPNGYPWTRRGFTYDWSPANPTHVGPQEYVVPGGTAVTILGVVSAEEYCR